MAASLLHGSRFPSLIIGLLLIASCTKTETVEPPAESTSKLLTYRVTNVSGTPILAAIVDSTITLTLPSYYYLTSVVPEITVSSGAAVSPGSETLVDSLLQYFEGTKKLPAYTVTGEDGSKTTYQLVVTVQQPDFSMGELTTDTANPATYTNDIYGTVSIAPSVSGTFSTGSQDLDYSLVKIKLTNEEGSQYVIDNNAGYKISTTGGTVHFYLPASTEPDAPPTGLYTLSVRFYSKEVSLANKIRIVQP